MSTPAIRKAKEADYPAIQEFLQTEWSPEHIFVKNQDFFKWQHLDRETGELNFLLLESQNKIEALIGYIPYRHWSPSSPENRVFLAIWKTSNNCKIAGAGFHLLRQIRSETKTEFVGAIGVSEIALPIYARLGYKTGLMDHFAVFNSKSSAKFLKIVPQQSVPRGNASIKEISITLDSEHISEICISRNSSKDFEYFAARYGSHPVYSYQAYSITFEQSEVILIAREINIEGSKVCRVVDAVGDFHLIPKSAGALKKLVEEKDYEYLDIYSTGLAVKEMSEGGFFVRYPNSKYVIPNHFEPLVMMNTELAFAWKNFGQVQDIVLFRGDSDQDRPNQVVSSETS